MSPEDKAALAPSRCALQDVKAFVEEHHYAHSVPGGVDFSFRLDYKGELAGACLIGMKTGNVESVIVPGNKPTEERELVRLVLLDNMPSGDKLPFGGESLFVSWCLRYMQKNPAKGPDGKEYFVKALVSFADPEHGHEGIVYKATNWRNDGLQQGRIADKIIINGEDVHPRTVVSRYGTAEKVALINIAYRRRGHKIEFQPRSPKHRYVYILRD